MNSVQVFLISCLAFCPIVILFGPILYKLLSTKEIDLKEHAISTLRDIDRTKIGFLIWINLYMISQLVFVFLGLPFIIKIPTIIYILGITSLLSGIISYIFLSTNVKHMILIGLSFLTTIFPY